MTLRILHIIPILIFSTTLSIAQQESSWTTLSRSLSTKNLKGINDAGNQLITKEGVDLRTLLSIVRSNDIPLNSALVSDILSNYKHYKHDFFQTKPRFLQIDSLYTEVYIYHRNTKIMKEVHLKDYEKEPPVKYNNRVKTKYERNPTAYGYYDYLKTWLENPGQTEDEAILSFIRVKGIKIERLLSYKELIDSLPLAIYKTTGFDTAVQKKLTYYRIQAIDNEKTNNYKRSLTYRDSIRQLSPLIATSEYGRARNLAMKQRLPDEYLYFLSLCNKNAMVPNFYGDTMMTFGRTKDDTAFVKSVLKKADLGLLTDNKLPEINYDLLLLSNRYAELHDFCSNIVYPKIPVLENKSRKGKLFVDYVNESFTDYPYAIRFLFREEKDYNQQINFTISYITIHLVQYNLKEQTVADADFERYLEMIMHLVRIKAVDADDYFWLTDCYATAVKGKQSSFGWKMGLKKETFVDNSVIRKSRSQLGLVPKEYMEYLAH